MYLQGLTSLLLYVLQTHSYRGLLHYYCTFYRHIATGAYFTTTVRFTDMYLQGLTSLLLYVLQTHMYLQGLTSLLLYVLQTRSYRGLTSLLLYVLQTCISSGLTSLLLYVLQTHSYRGLLHYYCTFYRHIATGAYFTTTVRFTDT